MTAAPPGADLWRRRADRAAELARSTPAAREMLDFYIELLDLQEPLFYHPEAKRLADACEGRGRVGPARTQDLGLRDLDVAGLTEDVLAFVDDVGRVGTADLRAFTAGLSEDRAVAIVTGFLRGDAEQRVHATPPERFVAQAFLEPFALRLEAAATPAERPSNKGAPTPSTGRGATTAPGAPLCPLCGEPPQMAVIRDDAERPGALEVHCPLCTWAQALPRLTCANCRQDDTELLRQHTAEPWSHVTLQTCAACGRYMKIFDLRVNGRAVPTVDDIASTELDLWARAQGWTRVRGHLLDP